MFVCISISIRDQRAKIALKEINDNYTPELDESAELSAEDAAYFQSLINVLRQIVEFGRVDINCEVAMLSSCMALLRVGHLEQTYNIFAYLINKKTLQH